MTEDQRFSLPMLVFRYSLFAALATLANLATQRLVLAGSDSTLRYFAAVAAGTLVGLIIKYWLDKRWIFADMASGLRQHSTKFALYTAMGLLTTAIFWGTETVFWLIGRTTAAREAGAVLGLAVGYVVKFELDRRYVFTESTLNRKVWR